MFMNESIRAALEAHQLEAIIVASPENVLYLTGADIHTQRTIPDRLALVAWPASGNPVFIVCNLEEAQARDESRIEDVRAYFEFKETPVAVLAGVLRELGVANGRLGIEKHFLTAVHYEELRKSVSEAQLVEAGNVLEKLRMIKTPEEITVLERAALATDRAIRKTFETSKVGQTESHIATSLQVNLLLEGADAPKFVVLAAGRNGCVTHPVPGGYQVEGGDLVRTDFGGSFRGYLSDLARTAVFRNPAHRQRTTYAWLWDTHNKLIERMRAGVRCCDIYHYCRALYEEAGMPFARPHIGHSLGLSVHEYPMFHPYNEQELRPNMVMAIEPNHLIPSVEKYHVEDLVLITEGNPRILSRAANWDELLVID